MKSPASLSRHLVVPIRCPLAIGHARLTALDRLPLAFNFYTRLSPALDETVSS
jgi:hypothetical protein